MGNTQQHLAWYFSPHRVKDRREDFPPALERGKDSEIHVFKVRGSILRRINGYVSFAEIDFFSNLKALFFNDP